MVSTRQSQIAFRSVFVAVVVIASVFPYGAAHWLVHHDAVYYRLMDAGRFGQFITNTAEMINILTPIPFVMLGLGVGISLAFALRCFRRAATIES